jgi:DNA-binding MarR family transcriptional regulator
MALPKPTLTLAEFLPYQLSVTSNAVSDLIARSYQARFGLKIPEWRVMAVLGECACATQRELTAATAMDKVTVNRACAVLVDRGLLGRAPNVTDRRSHHLTLTAVGRDLYDQIVPLAISVEQQLENILSADEASVLQDMLNRLHLRAGQLAGNFD